MKILVRMSDGFASVIRETEQFVEITLTSEQEAQFAAASAQPNAGLRFESNEIVAIPPAASARALIERRISALTASGTLEDRVKALELKLSLIVGE